MRAERRTHHRLAELARGQYGGVSRRQLRALGYSEATIGRELSAGRLQRIHRGVYAVGHRCLSSHGTAMAAVLAGGPNAMLSHRSAGWLWGLLPRPPSPPEVSRPTRGHARRGLRLHHAPALRAEDLALCERIPTTSVARTLLDLAAVLRGRQLERALRRAEELRVFDLRAVERLLPHVSGHAGAGRLRRAMGIYRDPAFVRSDLEGDFLARVLDAGLPRPATNVFVAGFELDAYWERERFAVELDTYRFHGGRLSFEEDRLRQEDLKLAGIEMVRITGARFEREPAEVLRRLATHLARRRKELGR